MRLVHFSRKPIEELTLRRYVQCPGYKPNGLWVSIGKAWKTWCDGESFNLDGIASAQRVYLTQNANILCLAGAQAIDRFTERYGTNQTFHNTEYLTEYIDWPRVAEDYQGIIIAPYCWSRRLAPGMMWYYGWDCASGCLWDLACVQNVARMRIKERLAVQR